MNLEYIAQTSCKYLQRRYPASEVRGLFDVPLYLFQEDGRDVDLLAGFKEGNKQEKEVYYCSIPNILTSTWLSEMSESEFILY